MARARANLQPGGFGPTGYGTYKTLALPGCGDARIEDTGDRGDGTIEPGTTAASKGGYSLDSKEQYASLEEGRYNGDTDAYTYFKARKNAGLATKAKKR